MNETNNTSLVEKIGMFFAKIIVVIEDRQDITLSARGLEVDPSLKKLIRELLKDYRYISEDQKDKILNMIENDNLTRKQENEIFRILEYVINLSGEEFREVLEQHLSEANEEQRKPM